MCGTEVKDILEFVEILTEVNTFLSVYFFVVASTDKYCCTYFTIQIKCSGVSLFLLLDQANQKKCLFALKI